MDSQVQAALYSPKKQILTIHYFTEPIISWIDNCLKICQEIDMNEHFLQLKWQEACNFTLNVKCANPAFIENY